MPYNYAHNWWITILVLTVMVFFIVYGAAKRWSYERFEKTVSVVVSVGIITLFLILYYETPLFITLPLSVVFACMAVVGFKYGLSFAYDLVLAVQDPISRRRHCKVGEDG